MDLFISCYLLHEKAITFFSVITDISLSIEPFGICSCFQSSSLKRDRDWTGGSWKLEAGNHTRLIANVGFEIPALVMSMMSFFR